MKILFLCTHNACRSILAQSITTSIGTGNLEAFSAGSHPSGQVHPDTLKQLTKRGYAINGLNSKSWDELHDLNPDIVITVCDQAAGETCPIWFGKAIKGHWGLPDPTKCPAAEKDVIFDKVFSILETRIRMLVNAIDHSSHQELSELIEQLGKDE
ncbi:protein tyrosine phosphatase [Marinomonas polaris DSM 16579]|uniref:Protein tyrosine phosphatase n=1 Tax=Marinomonas polaris DSM 16579 TaxID=1122206 RepID=A0A1M5KTF1_9GAMM|nr:arsenate reductase ArsC [Marinomonas polaris]SHG56048.1 protein tyrosine phosphatase [Marinomonas polaris DSM 16579]